MRKVIFVLCCVVLLGTLYGCRQNEKVYEQDAVRLHIVANSDSKTDQELKLAIRDLLLEKYSGTFALFDSGDLVWETVEEKANDIQQTVNDALSAQGVSYSADVMTGIYDFPDKSYRDIFYPAGKYRALKVVLGEGKGHNWWCVLYPPLCMVAEDENAAYYAELEKYLSGKALLPKANVRSWLMDKLKLSSQWDQWFARIGERYLKNVH